MSPARLAVLVDESPLPEEEARAFWARFSDYMDAHAGDLAGFAKSAGFASVHPEARHGVAFLIVSRSVAQRPYGSESPSRSTGGSPRSQRGGGRPKRNR